MKSSDPNIDALQNEIHQSKLELMHQTTVGSKIMAGPDLFDSGLIMMRSGIRMCYPEYNEFQIHNEVLNRLRVARQIDDGDRYRPLEVSDEEL
jgi:hypothetical protein